MFAAKIAVTAAFLCSAMHTTTITETPTKLSETSKQEALSMVNRLRAKGCHCGRKYMPPVGPIKWNAQLEQAALGHANDMLRNDFFAHQSSDGSGIGDRADGAGYKWRAVGENIAQGYPNFQRTLLAWQASPGHCINLMRGGYSEMGVALVGDIWVQDFGDPQRP